MASVTPDLPSCKASLPIGWYQIILLGDRGTCVLTTCPGLHSTAGGQDSNLRPVYCKSSILTTRPPSHTLTNTKVYQPICCPTFLGQPTIFLFIQFVGQCCAFLCLPTNQTNKLANTINIDRYEKTATEEAATVSANLSVPTNFMSGLFA